MAIWPFGKKKKKQQDDRRAAEVNEEQQNPGDTPSSAADTDVPAVADNAPATTSGDQATPQPAATPVDAPAEPSTSSSTAGVAALVDYDPVGGSTGPFDGDNVDIEDFDFSDFSNVTLNLGSIRVPLPKESQVQVEMGEQGPKMVHIVTRYGRITPVAFAAPRTGGLWEESSAEIIQGMRAEGMPVEVQQGPWGQEVVGTGSNGVIRIVGVEGPRWLYRVTLAAPTGSEEQLAEIGRETIARSFVYRGEDPILAGNSLQVVLPAQLAQQVQAAAEAKARQGQGAGQSPAEGNPNALSDALKQIIAQNAENQKQLQEIRERRAGGGSTNSGGTATPAAE